MSEGIRRQPVPAPGPLSAEDEAREARLRLKMERGEPLDADEKLFLARMPASREIPPGVVREAAARHGGVEPIDAATGRPHDPERPQ